MNSPIHKHFQKNDPILFSFIRRIKLTPIKKEKPEIYFSHLCQEIIRQQLSGKAADAIEKRFLALLPDGTYNPDHVLAITHDQIRNAGLSHSKANYIHNLAQHVYNKKIYFESFPKLSDEVIITELTQVKGIGRWTAEMFLIFAMGREDVFSFGDLGLKKGIMKIYSYKKIPSQKTIERIVRKWSPYKSYASRIVWKSLEL